MFLSFVVNKPENIGLLAKYFQLIAVSVQDDLGGLDHFFLTLQEANRA